MWDKATHSPIFNNSFTNLTCDFSVYRWKMTSKDRARFDQKVILRRMCLPKNEFPVLLKHFLASLLISSSTKRILSFIGNFLLIATEAAAQPKERTNTPGCNLIKIGFSPKTWKKLEPGLPLLSLQTCFTQFSITFLSLLFHPLRLQLKRLFSTFPNRANFYLAVARWLG